MRVGARIRILLHRKSSSEEERMHTSRFIIGSVLVFGLAGGTNDGIAGEQKISGSFAGSMVNSQIDSDGDGMHAILSTGRGKTNLGLAMFQTIGENAARLPNVKTCTQGHWEFPLLMSHGVMQFDDSGDQILVKYTSGVTCYDPATRRFTSTIKGNFVGGTGKFAEASGPIESTSTGYRFVVDPTDHEFDSFSGQFVGTIITP
jgi:hypothetical protein